MKKGTYNRKENNSRKTTVYSETKFREIIDRETGEFLREETESKQTFVNSNDEPPFIKLYTDDICRLKQIKGGGNNVLYEILKIMPYTNEVALSAPVRRRIAKNLDIKMPTVNKMIQHLYEKKILIRIERGYYLVNPKLFAKGRWDDIQAIRASIEWGKGGRNIAVEFVQEATNTSDKEKPEKQK